MRVAAVVSLLPILFGVGFAIYAFTVGSVTKIVISDQGEAMIEETIVEDSGAGGVALAFAPLALALFLATLLHLARRDSDQVALGMAWVFCGLIAVASAVGLSTVGVFFVVPAALMLIATGATQFVVSRAG
jgi:hypothetical protein